MWWVETGRTGTSLSKDSVKSVKGQVRANARGQQARACERVLMFPFSEDYEKKNIKSPNRLT